MNIYLRFTRRIKALGSGSMIEKGKRSSDVSGGAIGSNDGDEWQ
jgi:hypothetical protein